MKTTCPAWIWMAVALAAAAPAAARAAATTAPTADGTAATAAAPTTPAHPHDAAPRPVTVSAQGVFLPGGLRLNGRFDVAWERRGYRNNPGDGSDAIRNYHHFVFLSHDDVPGNLFLTAELIDQTFYEFGWRHPPRDRGMTASLRAGRLLVPFGPNPVFHHGYGGRSGFDQTFLPAVWARHGVAARGALRLGGGTLSTDVYAVHGYALRASDAVLDLVADGSGFDDARLAGGGRLGWGRGPLSLWASAYGGGLGFGRRLIMLAVDAGLGRLRGTPVIDRLWLGVGAARADTRGGTAPRTYHAADYIELRIYATDGLYLQSRAGLTAWDNRAGLLRDSARQDARDVTSYNVGMIWSWRGLTASLHHFWNLEAKDEVDDDLMRLSLAYAF